MNRILTILTGLLLSAALTVAEQTTETSAEKPTILVAEVQGMVCAFCAQGIDKKLSKLENVESVFINLKKKVVAVAGKKDATLAEKEIEKIITDAGFSVKKLERRSVTLEEFKEETEKQS